MAGHQHSMQGTGTALANPLLPGTIPGTRYPVPEPGSHATDWYA